MSADDLLPNERRALEAEKRHEEQCATEASDWARAERNLGNTAKADSLNSAALDHLRRAALIAERLA